MRQDIETVIDGGGQAGLATSYHLSQHGREHVILEQPAQAGRPGADRQYGVPGDYPALIRV